MLKNKIIILLSLYLFSCSSNLNSNILKTNKHVSVRDKIAQMIMIRIDGNFHNKEDWGKKHLESLIKEYNIGGMITYTGSVHGTFYNIESLQKISKTPMFVAADYERGLGTFIDGTLFPFNMAVAATENSEFSYQQGQIISSEAKSIGVNMIFAPVLDINNNLNNPIINIRSYGDTPETVIKFGIPFIQGIQDGGLIACAKHYPGHGNTSIDSHTSLPIIDISSKELYQNELLPFKSACDSNVKSVMIGHIVIPSIDSNDIPATFSEQITQNILRNQWNYKGLIITDALEMGALTSKTWHGESAIRAIEGGADIVLLPLNSKEAIKSIQNAVKNGRLSIERINQSYNRIMAAKEKIGLFDKTKNQSWSDVENSVKISNNARIASSIAEKSITLVKNENSFLPFVPNKYKKVTHLLLSTDDDLRTRLNLFSRDVEYTHGNVNEIYVNDPISSLGIKDIINKVKDSNLIIVSMLIRIRMNKGISTIDASHNKLLQELDRLGIPIIGISFGSPYLPDYSNLDAYMCTYGYGSITLKAAADALFGRKNISGKLPVSLNDRYQQGHGILVKKKSNIFHSEQKIDLTTPLNIINQAIKENIFPGAQIFISKGEKILLNDGFGHFSYDVQSNKINSESIYDVASLTKVLATTPVVMKLLQKKRIGLDYPLYDFYSEFKEGSKKELTIRHLLTHTSGLKSFKEYYKMKGYDSREIIIEDIIADTLLYSPDTKVVYSDLGMILLLDIIERITNNTLDKLSSKYFYRSLGMKNTFFNPNESKIDNIVPTENDTYFRMRLLQGEVHDENAYLLGGVSSHAGLFSTASDIGIFSKMLLNEGVHLGTRYLRKNIINKFTQRINIPQNSDRTIGWDTPSKNGDSSAGDYFSNQTYGHLGFTGTSLWIDPKQDLIVVLLTNRVHPTRNKKGIYQIRRDFHNALLEIIGD